MDLAITSLFRPRWKYWWWWRYTTARKMLEVSNTAKRTTGGLTLVLKLNHPVKPHPLPLYITGSQQLIANWLTHGTDYRRVSLMMLSMNGDRDFGPAWRKKEDVSNICCNNWTWTRLVVQLNLCFRLCSNRPYVLSLHVSLCTWLVSQGSVRTVSRWGGKINNGYVAH